MVVLMPTPIADIIRVTTCSSTTANAKITKRCCHCAAGSCVLVSHALLCYNIMRHVVVVCVCVCVSEILGDAGQCHVVAYHCLRKVMAQIGTSGSTKSSV